MNKRRIEARITQAGFDREDIKKFCFDRYGIGHFQHLDKEMYRDLMICFDQWEQERLQQQNQGMMPNPHMKQA